VAAPVSISSGSVTIDSPVTVVQGASGVDADPWNTMIRDSSGTELGLLASPFFTRLTDGTNAIVISAAGDLRVDGPGGVALGRESTLSSMGAAIAAMNTRSEMIGDGLNVEGTRVHDAAAVSLASEQPVQIAGYDYDGGDTTAKPFAWSVNPDGSGKVRLFNGSSMELGTASTPIRTDPTGTTTQPVDSELETKDLDDGGGTDTQAVVGILIEDTGGGSLVSASNPFPVTATMSTATTFAHGAVSVGTSETLISAASGTRRSLLIRNADSGTVVFLGATGVTTANGLPVGESGAPGATGDGGTVIYTHTQAIYGIVSSGTADIRFQTESD
jgi:hypothetical protein